MIDQEIVCLRDPLHSSVCYYGHNQLEVSVAAFDAGNGVNRTPCT